MTAHAQTRWIRGAIEGSERLCLPLPWERGGRRLRLRLRRAAALSVAPAARGSLAPPRH